MHAVAFRSVAAGSSALVAGLASALGLTRLEAQARLQAAGDGAAIARVFADPQAAGRCATELRGAGLDAWVIAPEADAEQIQVRRFTLDADALSVLDRTGRAASLRWDDIQLLVHGRRLRPDTQIQTVRRKKLSIPRAILTGGLLMTKTEVDRKRVTRGESEAFVVVEGSRAPSLCLRQLEIDYRGLGAPLAPSQAENFRRLVEALRQRAPRAVFDESLLDRTAVAHRLGPGLSPEDHMGLAIALVRADRAGAAGHVG
ncbi:MAG: hypothetical protein ACM3OB_04300 [Acidobacteriota bacterium]